MIDWLGQGKFAICFGCSGALKAKNQGLPIEIVRDQSVERGRDLLGGRRHALASEPIPSSERGKSFHQLVSSRKGQMALQKLGDPDEPPNSARTDIPKDEVLPQHKLLAGGRYFDVTQPQFEDLEIAFKVAAQAMEGR